MVVKSRSTYVIELGYDDIRTLRILVEVAKNNQDSIVKLGFPDHKLCLLDSLLNRTLGSEKED